MPATTSLALIRGTLDIDGGIGNILVDNSAEEEEAELGGGHGGSNISPLVACVEEDEEVVGVGQGAEGRGMEESGMRRGCADTTRRTRVVGGLNWPSACIGLRIGSADAAAIWAGVGFFFPFL